MYKYLYKDLVLNIYMSYKWYFLGIPILIAIRSGQSDQHKQQQRFPADGDSMFNIHDRIIQCLCMSNIYIRFYRLTDCTHGN